MTSPEALPCSARSRHVPYAETGSARLPNRNSPTRAVLASTVLAILITGVVVAIGITALSRYYASGPYRYDSAMYRAICVDVYDQCLADGRWATACDVLTRHNSFDVVVRLLIWPELLRDFHGHLYVQVPLMALFFWLTLWYVYCRSGSYVLGVGAIAVALSFAPVYALQNIMDYWKESLAVWMLGSALVCWFLSEQGRRRGWSFASGLMWGVLVLQRPAIAVYGLALFAPLLGYAAYRRFREDDLASLVRRASAFAVVPLALGTFAIIAQWDSVYQYYFVRGYGYGDPATVADWLLHHRSNDVRMASGVLGGLAICLLGSLGQWRERRADFAVAAWLLAGFAGVMIATRTQYPLWPMVAMVLAVVSLARATPREQSPLATGCVAAALLVLMATTGIIQARFQHRVLDRNIRQLTPVRAVFDDILAVVHSAPTPARPGLFFDVTDHLLWSQSYFDHGVKLPSVPFFNGTIDNYYIAQYGDLSPVHIAESIIADLEKTPGALAVVNRNVADFQRRLQRIPYAKIPDGPALQVTARIIEQLQRSPQWQVVREIDNAFYGPLLIYRCVSPGGGEKRGVVSRQG